MTTPQLLPLLEAKRLAAARFMRRIPSVVAVGIGHKVIDGQETDIPCVRVYVTKRFEFDDLSIKSLIPKEILGQPTDVIEVDQLGFSPVSRITVQRKADAPAFRPNLNPKLAGSVGAVLCVADDERYLLGANHVFSLNGRVPLADIRELGGQIIGETIPGRFVPLLHGQRNRVDGALGTLNDNIEIEDAVEIRRGLEDIVPPELGREVRKVGTGPEVRHGTIVDVSADFFVDYSFGTFLMIDQIFVKVSGGHARFADEGDSGAIIFDIAAGKSVGMVIASGGKFAAATPLEPLLVQLGVLPPEPPPPVRPRPERARRLISIRERKVVQAKPGKVGKRP